LLNVTSDGRTIYEDSEVELATLSYNGKLYEC